MIRRYVPLLLILFAVGALSACSGADPTPTPAGIQLTTPGPDPTATPAAVLNRQDDRLISFEVNLSQNGSPQQGTAVFRNVNGAAEIELIVRPGARVQQVNLRRGRCPDPEGFVESLNPAIGGILRQKLHDTNFMELLKGSITLTVSTDSRQFDSVAACADMPTLE